MDLFMNTMEFPLWLAIFTWVLLLYFIANSYYWATQAEEAERLLAMVLRMKGEEE